MIPRYQRILYLTLVGAILIMAGVLVLSRLRDHERIIAMRDQSKIAAPTDIPNESVQIAIANDADGTVTLDTISLALPTEPSLRAQAILARLLSDMALPASTHPIANPQGQPGPAVTDVFFVPLPLTNPSSSSSAPSSSPSNGLFGIRLAVINLTKAFADAHPSGIETEDLTLRAIIATLRANFPEITQVRFLVDGATRDTLAGHADLTHAYNVSEPEKSIHIAQ